MYYVTIPRSVIPDDGEWGVTTRPDDEVTVAIDIGDYLDVKIHERVVFIVTGKMEEIGASKY